MNAFSPLYLMTTIECFLTKPTLCHEILKELLGPCAKQTYFVWFDQNQVLSFNKRPNRPYLKVLFVERKMDDKDNSVFMLYLLDKLGDIDNIMFTFYS